MTIRNLSPDVVMHHMMTSLRLGLFVDNLCMHAIASLDELRKRATKFVQLEELREFCNQFQAKASEEKSKDEKDRQGRSSQRGDKRRDNWGD